MELLTHSQNSMTAPLKFGNAFGKYLSEDFITFEHILVCDVRSCLSLDAQDVLI